MHATFAVLVVAVAMAAAQWSQCKKVARPPAEQPETITSVALSMPRSVKIDLISASKMARPSPQGMRDGVIKYRAR